MDIKNVFSPKIEVQLKEFINTKLIKSKAEKYINSPIRDNVLNLLDELCIVIYYPLDSESNNGFHITDMPFADGSTHNFVYINTAQTMEKQVFTAAHELGHIWGVDDIVLKWNDVFLNKEDKNIRELIINRFAAMLLMPSNLFKDKWNDEMEKHLTKNNTLTIVNLLRIIVILMGEFFVPMKAVVLRLLELELISENIANMLLGNESISEVDIVATVQKIISSLGLIQFQKPTHKKWIEGFDEKLDKAESENLVSNKKIEIMRNIFELSDTKIISEMNSEIAIKK